MDGPPRAWQMIEAIDFDLVLLDIMMPGIDGYEVLERIRADPCGPAICRSSWPPRKRRE